MRTNFNGFLKNKRLGLHLKVLLQYMSDVTEILSPDRAFSAVLRLWLHRINALFSRSYSVYARGKALWLPSLNEYQMPKQITYVKLIHQKNVNWPKNLKIILNILFLDFIEHWWLNRQQNSTCSWRDFENSFVS